MIQIPVAAATDGTLSPSEAIPRDAIAVVCDGPHYIVYEPGDTVPAQYQG